MRPTPQVRKTIPKKTDTDVTLTKSTTPVKDAPSSGIRTTTPIKTTTPRRTTALGPPTGRPPTKQQLRLDTTYRPPGVSTPTTITRLAAPQPLLRWPTIGKGEKTSQENIDAVRLTWNMKKLADLWEALATERPRRTDLMSTVGRQIIRQQLREMMGHNIATQANIQVDGVIKRITPPRDVKQVKKPDVTLGRGTDRELAVWNASRYDAEVDTIRDVISWANTLNPKTLAEMRQIVIQLVGTSGPCEACKSRLLKMANAMLDKWAKDSGIPRDKLPELR